VADVSGPLAYPAPTLVPLGDSALLIRFAAALDEVANRAAIALARRLEEEPVPGVVEIMPNLVSVLLRYDPLLVSLGTVAGEVRLRLSGLKAETGTARQWSIPTVFEGPDLDEVADMLELGRAEFVAAHNRSTLRVLATGFAPGFVYCGLHEGLTVPRRTEVRSLVPAGSVLFAAGQTAIAATDMPTGWHVIGRTDFRNFDPAADPPTRLHGGDSVRFVVAP
jgi:KipI family sensor histidine kinase inhibitor